MAVEAWIDTEASEASRPVNDEGYAERIKTDMRHPAPDPPDSDFLSNISAALQVKRFAGGALNELEVMLMVSEVNAGQDPYIVAAKYGATVTEMLQALSKFAAEKWEIAQSTPKTVVIVVRGGKQLEVVQDGKICQDAEKTLLEVGLKPASSEKALWWQRRPMTNMQN
ncbi:hypothetical protein A1O7_02102 [Cladophialophora yegresii CBS 114405]|uniref:Uncharacterized protein n=1 Tax=Cladophialophora yegresii CBS 114405 TaxID=1182544 RepID=W9W143_9EURO|nr:uncharacterized protein A1O7_02102 [Cladophialophora yegresii CBS 114405]EXJ61673.1 hypothetical protein A1O7_02102 [Cladophialophora yegresii CBS 114405]